MNIIRNGSSITISGSCSNMSIINNEVYVNGRKIETGDEKTINLTIDGNVSGDATSKNGSVNARSARFL